MKAEPSLEDLELQRSTAENIMMGDEKLGDNSYTLEEVQPERGVRDANEREEDRKSKSLVIILLTVGLCLVLFATAVDNTILGMYFSRPTWILAYFAATAIPHITDDFRSLDDAGWYRTAYLVASTALQPSLGKFYATFSIKWTYLSGLVIFEVGSLVCALAPNSAALIAGRTVAGVGGAALYSGAINILGLAAPTKMRPVLFSIISSMFGVASLVGPPLGGVFTDSAKLTWRWCFWINLPLGSVAFVVILAVFRERPRKRRCETDGNAQDQRGSAGLPAPPTTTLLKHSLLKLDPVGTSLLIPAIVSLLLALQWGGIKYPWGDGRIWGCLLCFGFLTIALVVAQIVARDNATMPPRVVKQRTVLGGGLLMIFISAAMFTHVFYLPFYFQIVLGTTATGSGLRTLAYVGTMALSGIVAGIGMTRTNMHKPFACIGTATFVVGSGLLHTLSVDATPGMYAGYQVLAGVGLGAAWQVPFVAIQRATGLAGKLGDMAIANALMAFFNSLGAALGISIAQNVFAGTLYRQLAAIPGLQRSQATTIANIGEATTLRNPAFLSPELVIPVLEAFSDAISATFIVAIVAGGLSCLSSLIL